MLKLILAGAVAVPVAGAGVVAATGVAWVDVREGGRDGTHIVLPVPLALAQTAAAFVPDQQAAPAPRGRGAKYLPVAREALQALADAPDGELVRVEERDEQVVITKVGRSLHVEVKDHGDDVDVNVPIEMALEVMGRGRDDLPDPGHRRPPPRPAHASWSRSTAGTASGSRSRSGRRRGAGPPAPWPPG